MRTTLPARREHSRMTVRPTGAPLSLPRPVSRAGTMTCSPASISSSGSKRTFSKSSARASRYWPTPSWPWCVFASTNVPVVVHTIWGSRRSCVGSPRLKASISRRTISMFSCDIARPVSRRCLRQGLSRLSRSYRRDRMSPRFEGLPTPAAPRLESVALGEEGLHPDRFIALEAPEHGEVLVYRDPTPGAARRDVSQHEHVLAQVHDLPDIQAIVLPRALEVPPHPPEPLDPLVGAAPDRAGAAQSRARAGAAATPPQHPCSDPPIRRPLDASTQGSPATSPISAAPRL